MLLGQQVQQKFWRTNNIIQLTCKSTYEEQAPGLTMVATKEIHVGKFFRSDGQY